MATGEELTVGRLRVKKQNNLFDTNTNTFNFKPFLNTADILNMLFRNFHHLKTATDVFICMPDVSDKTFFFFFVVVVKKLPQNVVPSTAKIFLGYFDT
jgi:hypothetical protein